jgi:hypothetical protein
VTVAKTHGVIDPIHTSDQTLKRIKNSILGTKGDPFLGVGSAVEKSMKRSSFPRMVWLVWWWPILLATSVSGETLTTPHFLVVYPSCEASFAQTIASSLEKARETLTLELTVKHNHPLKVRLVPRLTYQGLARYVPDRRTMEVLTKAGLATTFDGQCPPLPFIEGVLWHEYVHFLQHQVMKRFIKDRTALWFIEGTAEFLGTLKFIPPHPPETVWAQGKTMLSDGRLPTLDELNRYHITNQYPVPTYFFSADAVKFLIREWGMERLQQITKALGEGKGFLECLKEGLGIDRRTFEQAWHRDLETRYKVFIKNS